MKIPVKFELLGKVITVRYDPKLHCKGDNFGYASYREEEIVLLPISEATTVTQQGLEQAFCHELVHHISYYAGTAIQNFLGKDNYLHKNEEFVDLFASLLHQVLITMEYEDEA